MLCTVLSFPLSQFRVLNSPCFNSYCSYSFPHFNLSLTHACNTYLLIYHLYLFTLRLSVCLSFLSSIFHPSTFPFYLSASHSSIFIFYYFIFPFYLFASNSSISSFTCILSICFSFVYFIFHYSILPLYLFASHSSNLSPTIISFHPKYSSVIHLFHHPLFHSSSPSICLPFIYFIFHYSTLPSHLFASHLSLLTLTIFSSLPYFLHSLIFPHLFFLYLSSCPPPLSLSFSLILILPSLPFPSSSAV